MGARSGRMAGLAALATLTVFTAVRCDAEFAPALTRIGPRTAYVGTYLSIELSSTEREGMSSSFDYNVKGTDSMAMPNLKGRSDRFRPTLMNKQDGTGAVFTWRPLAADVGTWHVTFSVSDGGPATEENVTIVVKPAQDGDGPSFLEPGDGNDGTSLDIRTAKCFEVKLLAYAPLAARGVQLGYNPPLPGAMLDQRDLLSGLFTFCPTAQQIAQTTSYPLTFTADDGDHEVAKDYTLQLTSSPTCMQGMCCQDDLREPNDDGAHATVANASPGAPFSASGLMLCPGNDDFYAVSLQASQTVVVDLTFHEANDKQDLDVHFYDTDGKTDLTPCPPTCTTNGQSSGSNEHFEQMALRSGIYYVVVRGFNGSSNTYSIRIAVK